jgi:hypothetical protein
MQLNDSTRVTRRPPRAWLAEARTAAAVIATAGLALLMAACGGSPRATKSGSSANARASTSPPSAIAFARCMRSHGVQHWPDPERNGQFDKSKLTLQQLGVLQSQLQVAQRACQRLFPNSSQSPQANDQQVMDALFTFARCVRAHGVSNWPDPLAESDPGQPGTPGFPRDMPGVNQNAPQVKNAMGKCRHVIADIGYGSGGYP